MVGVYSRLLIVLSCLILSSNVRAQTTSDDAYKRLKSIFGARQQKIEKRQKGSTSSTRKIQTSESTNLTKQVMPVPMSFLHKYNVVAISYELLSNAQRQCRKLLEHGYPAMIYIDSNDYYRVIAGSFDDEREALDLRAYILDAYPESWILCVEDGYEKRYVQERSSDANHVYDVIEEMPQFPGGPSALFQYLSKNIVYPEEAEQKGIQGRVILSFVVEPSGGISDIRVVQSVDRSLDAEAIRVVATMPRWIPGKIDGTPVRVKYTVPVTFRLQ